MGGDLKRRKRRALREVDESRSHSPASPFPPLAPVQRICWPVLSADIPLRERTMRRMVLILVLCAAALLVVCMALQPVGPISRAIAQAPPAKTPATKAPVAGGGAAPRRFGLLVGWKS